MKQTDYPFVCVVGAPRSGTTILGRLLSQHPDIAYLFEPYFVWDFHLGPMADDVRTAEMASPEIARFIRREFGNFLRRSGRKVVVDKSPFSSFRIPFIGRVFPHTRYIHIQRDGRDVALSTRRKWLERVDYTRHGNYRQFLWEVRDKLGKRPDWRLQMLAIIYELRYNVRFRTRDFYASYYGGKPGWGVRYPGFEKDLGEHTLLQFNALQWLRSVEQIEADLRHIPDSQQLTLRYEDFLASPREQIARLLRFIGLPQSDHIDTSPVSPDKQVTGSASAEDLEEMLPVIQEKLEELGYLEAGVRV